MVLTIGPVGADISFYVNVYKVFAVAVKHNSLFLEDVFAGRNAINYSINRPSVRVEAEAV